MVLFGDNNLVILLQSLELLLLIDCEIVREDTGVGTAVFGRSRGMLLMVLLPLGWIGGPGSTTAITGGYMGRGLWWRTFQFQRVRKFG